MRVELLGLDRAEDSVIEGRWELGDREYIGRLDWSDRDESYALSIYTVDRKPLLLGHMPRTGADCFDNISVEGRPPGKLTLEDTTGQARELGWAGFRDGFRLVYEEAD